MAADESHAESCGIQIGIEAFLDSSSHFSSVPTSHVRGSPFLSSAQGTHFAFFFFFFFFLHPERPLEVGSSEAPGLCVCPCVGDSSMEMRREERNRLCVVSADVLGLFQTCEFTPGTSDCPLVTQSDSSFSLSSQHLSFTFR